MNTSSSTSHRRPERRRVQRGGPSIHPEKSGGGRLTGPRRLARRLVGHGDHPCTLTSVRYDRGVASEGSLGTSSSPSSLARLSRVLVVGSGGLGGIVSASLLEHAQSAPEGAGSIDVVTLTTNASIAEAVNARGFQIRGTDGARTVAGKAKTALAKDDAPFDWVILAVQPPQVEEAAASVLPWLAPSGSMVCLQNGLCEPRVAKIAGEDRVIGAVVAWGGAMPEPPR